MADKSSIEWTDATWNPVTGCTKVSAGCKHCYAERDWARLAHLPAYAGRAFTDVRCHQGRLDQPLRWRRPRRIFVNSMSDLFHPDVPNDFIHAVFAVMALARQHTFQVLTKRPERMAGYLRSIQDDCKDKRPWIDATGLIDYGTPAQRAFAINDAGWPLNNVWLGVSVEDQATANERIPLLLKTPAAVHWVSAEPLLGPVNLHAVSHLGWGAAEVGERLARIDWLVVGGESGPKARPMHPDWPRILRDQCASAGVPFLFKQWGEWVPRSACYHTFEDGLSCADHDPGANKWPCIRLTEGGHNGRDLANLDGGDDAYMQRVGKKMAGRLLDGVLHGAYPEPA
jgi:protein gp37